MKDGVIKFDLRWQRGPPPGNIDALLEWRDRMRAAELIGVYPDGVGYGNISIRAGAAFIISGSGTGAQLTARREHFTEVVDYDFNTNSVTCRGPVRASSESLTHAAVYEADPSAAAVIHVHHPALWEALIGKIPTTAVDIEYGTREMAEEVMRLFRDTPIAEGRLFVLGGHRDGIVAFGESLREAGTRLLDTLHTGPGEDP
ncbi:MAG: class II aldolase/adducin family protein [Gammaproteobacteria bacterium]|nr:class II aldolase/adducin family protein [Gammaproteobacteria bacterium]NIM72832.1 class II aldolase/adducin family protein [Gammaproteobacteria bacterium]NIN38290.1 class II aldolase/adducin family protein [Gammaproteobacteria bacterium]NIO24580.1 class II aldolase/adducin family protein [Gammaproteobacteria bacterium]NIO65189.1 class II aldolase/adducin family protein [Gammaproteobacteria bacterium]